MIGSRKQAWVVAPVVLLGALLLGAGLLLPAPAVAATPGIHGWYWPVGTSSFDMSGWWNYRGYCWHLAQDMRAAVGSPVHAVDDGIVLESKYVRGYGPGGSLGGAVVILHRDYQGYYFKALYGHLYGLRYAKGSRVPAGAVIGRVNGSSPPHVHFGIHPGIRYPSDNNPYRGHTYTSRNTFGWVDPVRFLKTRFRNDPYRAPAVPVVDSVETTGRAAWARARGGRLYWATSSEGTTTMWACALPNGAVERLETTATVPPHDSGRYSLTVRTTLPNAVIVRDKRPRLSMRSSSLSPAAGSSVTLSGTVKNAAGSSFAYPAVYLERWTPTGWARVTKVYAGSTGVWSKKLRIDRTVRLRARFVPPKAYSVGYSGTLTIVAR